MLILKQLRRKKSITQSQLAETIGVSLRTIQIYEKENANIPRKRLDRIAAYFELRIDELYAREVNESDVIYEKEDANLKKAHTIQKLEPGKYLLSAPLIMGKGQLDFMKRIDDKTYLSNLPRIGFMVEQVAVGNYLAFEVTNNAMDNGLGNALPQKSIVLGKLISPKQVVKQIERENSYWVLVYGNSIMCKEITHYDKASKAIRCHSLNNSPEYSDFEVPIADVVAFYKIIKKQVD